MRMLTGFRTGFPRMYHFGVWIILSWKQPRHCGLKRNVYLPLKELKLGILPKIVSPEITLYDLSVRQDKLLTTKHLNDLPPFWSPRVPHLIPSSECHLHLLLTSSLWPSHACGVPIHTHIIKFAYFLLLICLMLIWLLHQPEEPRMVKSLPPPRWLPGILLLPTNMSLKYIAGAPLFPLLFEVLGWGPYSKGQRNKASWNVTVIRLNITESSNRLWE